MPPSNGKKVLVAMSGGVDSSVAAAILQQQGYEVVGCFMRLGNPRPRNPRNPRNPDPRNPSNNFRNDEPDLVDGRACDPTRNPTPETRNSKLETRNSKQGCCSVNDAADARHVAAKLGIAFYVLNFRREFDRVIDYFIDEYNAGRTPNPCVRCNDWLKFGRLHEVARSLDCHYVASGHYARIQHLPGDARLLRGLDPRKDQSYVLFGTPRKRLEHMLLPIGDLDKTRTRRLAEQFDLPVFNKPDSQEICFVHDAHYADLLRQRVPGSLTPGQIVDPDGNVVGRHDGQQAFTIGQRRGVGVAMGYPIYVVDKDPRRNTVTIGPRAMLRADGCAASQVNWLVSERPAEWRACAVKVRYNSDPAPGSCRFVGDDQLHVRFDQPIEAVTPGQAVVCYDGETVLGGGWIDRATRCDGERD